MIPTEIIEDCLDLAYEFGEPQEKIDALETLYAERVVEHEINMIEHEINITEDELGVTEGLSLDKLLAMSYQDVIEKRYTKDEAINTMRANIRMYGGRNFISKKATDKAVWEAGKESYHTLLWA